MVKRIPDALPVEIKQNCEVYYLHGKLKVNELSWNDRLLLKMGAWLVKDPLESKKMTTDYDDVK